MSRFLDLLLISVRQVVRQYRRYLGVVLAITLGTAGFIVVITMGRDVKKNLNQDLELLGGATLVKAYFEDYVPGLDRSSRPQWFHADTVSALKKIPGVNAVSVGAMKTGPACSTYQKSQRYFPLFAVDNFFWRVNGISPKIGALFDAKDVDEHRRVCVLGGQLAQRLFGTDDVAGRLLPLDNDLYVVAGVVDGTNLGDRNGCIFVPLTTAQDRIQGLTLPERMYIRCSTWDDVGRVAAAIPDAVNKHQSPERLKVEGSWEHLKRVQRIAWWVELFIHLSIVATLVLGGFGIWNGMMAAVQSRTREIGLKKAMGAEDRDILIQFLSEALCLSFGSALLGTLLGRASVKIISSMLEANPPEDLFVYCAGLALLFSLALGMGAGFYPSVRASRMQIVSALRYE